ncbi:MAG TPA: TonB-dependent receptor [Chlorobaculum sp.]|uniref:Ferric siderophore receptor, putative, TonB receptor family n=2 Tax=Chlorobaculum tepidum TaxID=1097 RepID=Q8KB41_CHLTE|nr:TonB-dependent receptor [Chlorobaculum tepidum]AAM73172.1 ferric siderophore receptor, putative, TonB receptor family [Chlorobaculum tepidum TLS]HBU23268.1 TonB-dependent receptor [Chlorobaculum sp.]
MKKQQAKGSGMKRLALSATFLATTLAPVTTWGADGVIRGRVTDKADGEGVVGAAVSIAGTNIATATDINGNFVLRNVPASKQQKVIVTSIGYAPTTQVINLGDGQTATLNIALGQTTIMASEVVVGAALYKQDRLDVPVTANIVTKEQIREEPNPTLDEVVQDVPGVVVSRAGGTSSSNLQIRGSNTYNGGGIGTRVNAFYDGFPINSPDSGEIVWQSVNMNAADKVEVLKGAAATLYGSGAMGGVVNITGHLPDKFEVKAGSGIGFYDKTPSSDESEYRKGFTPVFWNTYAGFGNKSGKWTYDFLYSHSDDDGYRQNAWNYMNDVKFKARYDIDSRQYLQLTSFYNSTVGGYAYQWPYNATISTSTFTPILDQSYDVFVNARLFPTHTAAFSYAQTMYPTSPFLWDILANAWSTYTKYDVYTDDLISRKNALVGINYVNLLSDKLSLDTRLYYTYNASRIEYNRTDADQTYATGRIRTIGEFNETDDSRYGAGIKLDWRASDNHRLLFGVDGNIVDTRTTQVAVEYPVKNEFNNIQEKNFAVFLQDEWKITDKLTSLMSLRYDWSGVNKDEVEITPGVWIPINKKSVDALSPRVALNYRATDDMALRASWGRSFRAPSLYERFVHDAGFLTVVPNPDLDKETMTAWEAGIFKQFSDKVSLDIAGFINNYDNLIESRPTAAPLTYMYGNITKARIWGIETNLNYRPNTDWNLSVGYTYMNAKNRSFDASTATATELNNPDPEWLPYRPEHTASASVTWKATKKLTLNVNGRYVGKYKAVTLYTNPDGKWYPGDFVVFNAGLKYQFNKNVTATLACNNINNTQYSEAEWFRAPNRSFIAGIDLTY